MATNIVGSGGVDIIATDLNPLDLDDIVTAFGANDTIFGGGGSNEYNGGPNVDLLTWMNASPFFGEALSVNANLAARTSTATYNPTITGGLPHTSADTLSDIENLDGSSGGDTLIGDSIANRLRGFGGDDNLQGRGGDDTLIGGAGNDSLVGNIGNDDLRGGGGADSLTGGPGTDAMFGGPGNDTFVIGATDGTDNVRGGDGTDTIQGDGTSIDLPGGFNLSNSVEMITNVMSINLQGRANANFLGTDLDGAVITAQTFGNQKVVGSAGNDDITGGELRDRLLGGPGDDVLRGEDGNDLLRGEGGDDDLHGGNGSDRLLGLRGNDTLHGGPDKDVLIGGEGSDTFRLVEDHLALNDANRDYIPDFKWMQFGDQDFVEIDVTGFPGNHSVSISEKLSSVRAILQINSPDAVTEFFEIKVTGDPGMTIEDFVAGQGQFWGFI